jgi:hypothetical protein
MPYVILDAAGEPLRDLAGVLIVLPTRTEAERWLMPGWRVRPLTMRDRERERPLPNGLI